MANLPIYDKTGAQVGELEVNGDAIAPKGINKQLLHDAVVMYQANLRQGSVKTKSRSEVAGTGKKLYRQKGTGNARAGMRQSGVRRGGGHIFALRPRDWSYRLPRKALKAATKMAVASKINGNFVKLVDTITVEAPKTKEIATLLKNLSLGETSLLIVVEAYNQNVLKSVRNIPRVNVLPVRDINAYAVLRPKQILMTKAAMEAFVAGAASAE